MFGANDTGTNLCNPSTSGDAAADTNAWCEWTLIDAHIQTKLTKVFSQSLSINFKSDVCSETSVFRGSKYYSVAGFGLSKRNNNVPCQTNS